MKRFLQLGLTAALALAACAKAEDRKYHLLAIQQMAAEDPAHWKKMHTHVAVQGFITYVKLEADGDTHIRICDSPVIKAMDRKSCIVAECIPELSCAKPHKGDRVEVRGISRFDAESPGHHWWEIHPVEAIEKK